ncbi:hypothetical protein B0I75DRAFT_157650 [Yarrowia lipolytica]|nr:hypothetical protein B0I74DRAFT_176025 [Yarrowia lipolytica]RDW53495.1 hypothetical protein B0I75DRAFT_157650 [Yarrowia lipolytica]
MSAGGARGAQKHLFHTINSLDDSLVRPKVQSRGPWFSTCKNGDTLGEVQDRPPSDHGSKPVIVSVDATDSTNYPDKAVHQADLGQQWLGDAQYLLYGHLNLPQNFQNLSACRVGFPTGHYHDYPESSASVMGKKEHRMDRYVAIDKRHGQAVIDLLTGKMHMCEFDHPKDLILPLMGNGPKIVLRPSMRWFSHVLKRLCQLSSKTSGARPVPQLAPDSGLYEVAKAGDHIYTKGSEKHPTFPFIVICNLDENETKEDLEDDDYHYFHNDNDEYDEDYSG